MAPREFQGLRPEKEESWGRVDGRTHAGRGRGGGDNTTTTTTTTTAATTTSTAAAAKAHSTIPLDAGMESARAHGITRLDPRNGSRKITGRQGMRSDRHRGGHLHLQRAVIFLVALAMQPQVSHRFSAISGAVPLNPQKLTFNCASACISHHSCVKTVSNGVHTHCPFPLCAALILLLYGAVPTCCFSPLLSIIPRKR